MFYHPLLLHHQHKMQLNLPWLAATLGIKYMKKEDILACDCSKLCGFILQFLKSDSRDPTKRMSLRLSTMLIHGTVLIWRHQVIFLKDEIDQLIKAREDKLKYLLSEVSQKPQPRHVVKKKKPKTRAIVETPPSLVGILEHRDGLEVDWLRPIELSELVQEGDEIRRARIDEITLKDEVPRPQEPSYRYDDFGEPPAPVTDGMTEPPQAVAVPTEEQEMIPPGMLVSQQEVVPDIVVLPSSPRERVVEVPVLVQKEFVEEIIEEREIPEKEAPPVEEAIEPTKKRDARMESEDQGAKKKSKSIADQLRIKRSRKKCITQKIRIFDDRLVRDIEAIREITKKFPDFMPMKKFWPDWEESVEYRREHEPPREPQTSRTPGTSDSLEPRVDTPSLASHTQSLTGEIRPSEPPFTSTPTKRPLRADETVIEIMPPAANGTMFPTKRRKVATADKLAAAEQFAQTDLVEEHPLEKEQAIPESIIEIETIGESRDQILPPRSEKEVDDRGIKWSVEIMRLVYKHEKITPVNICKGMNERLTKLNMALIFNSLLALAKYRYVLLHPAPDSLELETVEKGPKEFF